MPLPSLSFALSLLVLAYLSSFVLFALIRIITGVSVQRLGLSGLRRIAFSPRDGINVRIRGVGVSLHRPTFAQPTWFSITITELQVILDLDVMRAGEARGGKASNQTNRQVKTNGKPPEHENGATTREDGARKWQRLTELKERIKLLHRQIQWIRLVDLVVLRSSLTVKDVAAVRVERLNLIVDTRTNTVDRSRLFSHHKTESENKKRPAEWKCIIRSIIFTPEGKDPTELLDYCLFGVHGFLHQTLDGLRDASVSLKMGRLTVPYDDLENAAKQMRDARLAVRTDESMQETPSISLNDVAQELDDTESKEEQIVHAVAGSRNFTSSILRGIQEIQLAVGFLGLSKRIKSVQTPGQHVFFNMAMKEVGLEVTRLDAKSPAHRMYFSPKDVAHQALLTGISIAAGVDDGNDDPERMFYIPMVTATIKTTLPSKTIQYSVHAEATDRNSNILFANLVCTSPSVDVDPKHLTLLRAIASSHTAATSPKKQRLSTFARHDLISRLLPKASIKLAVQEPVVRVTMRPTLASSAGTDEPHEKKGDIDMIISSTSSMSLDLESQHSYDGPQRYGLSLSYRQTAHQLYGQTVEGTRHEMLLTDAIELKVDMTASPDISVMVAGRFKTFSLFLIQPDICQGLKQIVQALRKDTMFTPKTSGSKKPNFLRQMPGWLQHVDLQGLDFSVEVTGKDEAVSKYARGLGLQLEGWSIEYKSHRDDMYDVSVRRRSSSRNADHIDRSHDRSQTPTPHKKPHMGTDGRRLTFHANGLEGLVIDSRTDSSADSFLTLPRFEIALSTASDSHGPLFHLNSHVKKLFIHYSLYNHFALGIAFCLLRRTFETSSSIEPATDKESQHAPSVSIQEETQHNDQKGPAVIEITTMDFRAGLIQVKANTPAHPPLMLQLYGIEAGRHRWAEPFFRTKLARLYADTPSMRGVWSRVVSIKTLRVDLRSSKRKLLHEVIEERAINVATEAIRIGIPHQLIVHSIFDNIINTVKTVEQMHHHFSTGSDKYVLTKHPEGPKHVPKVIVRSQVLIFEVEDSAFEWKLGTIYRAGLMEQKQRQAREEAFRLKAKRCEAQNHRKASGKPPQRDRSPSHGGTTGKRSTGTSEGKARHGRLRYDAEGQCNMTGSIRRSIEQAQETLDRFNAQSWKKRIDRALSTQKHVMQDLRSVFWGLDELDEEDENTEPIMGMTMRPGLLVACISDLSVAIDKPSFPLKDLPHYLHDIGKGMPTDMQYGLLIPMHLKINMGEIRVTLRDYPLPLLHVPAIRAGQSPRLPSLDLSTDFVIAEEFRDIESQLHVNVVVVPPEKLGEDDVARQFAIDVRRTISPVKTYTNMKIEINTSSPTRITWGTSYQPAIQDMMQVIEGFTKDPIDPSDRVGFWDKIRLSFHSRIVVSWKGDGDMHLNLKGSRNPYVVTGHGAGFVMVWRNNVCWRIAQDEDARKFMTVDSGDYILAIPDFNHYARSAQEADDGRETGSKNTEMSNTAMFKKVVMKLSGNVQWLMGLVFEKALEGDKRSFDFRDHYDVVLKHPDHAKAPPGAVYDAYHGFRSQHIHMSIAVVAPHKRDWNAFNIKPSDNYNSVHLSPRFFTHFLNWWSMFSGVMSLPVRQGPLWGSQEKSSKKFGRHLATLKYNLLLSPVFISHIYKHKDAEDYKSDVLSATGLKMKIDSFMLDLHQRRETFEIAGHSDAKSKKTSGMKINEGQLDFIHGDIRAVSASIRGTSSRDLDKEDDNASTFQSGGSKIDMSKFTIPDNDFTWIDMDDFVELDWILPQESNPETKILPLATAPRFTYFRQTDHGDSVSGDKTRSSPFGDEPTHYCVISAKNHPGRIQAELVQDRLNSLVGQIASNERAVGEQHLKVVKDHQNNQEQAAKLKVLREHTGTLQRKHEFLDGMLKSLLKHLDDRIQTERHDKTSEEMNEWLHKTRTEGSDQRDTGLDPIPLDDDSTVFNNRFAVHNAQIKWNNSLRNIILRYIHQVGQRRGFVYFMSRRAVKFILDILEDQKKQDAASPLGAERRDSNATAPVSPGQDDDATVQDRIDQILHDGKAFVNADDPQSPLNRSKSSGQDPDQEISTEFISQDSYHFRLIAPQIQMQSDKNPKSVMMITAKSITLKVTQIMDKDRVMDEVSGLVQRRFNASMDSLQVFIASTKTFSSEFLSLYTANRYGAKAGSYWPPWVPMEVMYEYDNNPYGFNRVVQRTSASLRYDKYNTLRLKYNDDVSSNQREARDSEDSSDNRMDHLWVEFPQFRAICDSQQYYAMYIIGVDLLLYSEPLEKTRTERLEKIMLASDFSDLTGAPEMVEKLQERISQLEEIKVHFQVNEKLLDRQGWLDRISMDHDLTACEDELFFMMKAITTSQQRVEERNATDGATGMLRWLISSKEIAWHLIREKGESLMELQLKDGSFDRTDMSDGSNVNCVELGRINGFNLLPNAIYPQIIAPYIDESRGFHENHDTKMLRIHWLMLEAIAGIPVVDYFEVDLVPVRVQLEREVAKRIFEYIFPGVGGSAFEGSGFSPMMVKKMLPTQEEEDESNNKDGPGTPDLSADQVPESDHHQGTGTGAGSLEQRLQPTMNLAEKQAKPKKTGLGISSNSSRPHFSLFQHGNRSNTSVAKRSANKPSPNATLSRTPSQQSIATSEYAASTADGDKSRKNGITRRSADMERKKDKEHSDDLTMMMNRASNYTTLGFFKVHGMVLCLSYKGRGQRNLEDVHDLVFRMPTLEYRNKTWSNLDLALQLKKDVIKALISHAGAIVGNKLSHHRPSKQQQSRFRELANSSTLLSIANTPAASATPSDDGSSSLKELNDDEESELQQKSRDVSERPSFGTNHRSASYASSTAPWLQTSGTTSSPAPSTPVKNGSSSSQHDGGADGPVAYDNVPVGSPGSNNEYPNGHASNGNDQRSRDGGGGSLSQRFSGFGYRHREATPEDSEESNRIKSKLLLGGKKLRDRLGRSD